MLGFAAPLDALRTTETTWTSFATPVLVDTFAVIGTDLPAAATSAADTTTLSSGAGLALPESDGVGAGESSADADAPPAARTAAAPSPTKIGFTAGRQYTAPAPPSHRL
ncbi:hypothetical protein ACTIVE_3317 [Actinomadura verrucosospora]|uniref:Uncharacterized protein n=1 Tax=Actinomadura verrucosospora TaxID=46165 RepID=A0A7D3VST7_ACTVE|nr:hypothetical protein ACTIVE_3317 [Actinomadura verrucosospora]